MQGDGRENWELSNKQGACPLLYTAAVKMLKM